MKCGIEIHQRLATARKLFCDCPTRFDGDEQPFAEVARSLKPVYGELGQVDPAAEFEAARKRSFAYQLFAKSTCLVEIDDSPPRELNREALEAALEIALLLGARVLDEVHAMRKTVIDGSSPSAFQRTALVAVDGELETSFGRVKIPSICLEEESSGIVGGREAERVVYRLDRLGIPLVEIATDASIASGAQARETAERIGALLRSTGKVQRGIGTIRQDLNVSVEGGQRVEIKGVQELELLPKIVENEALRQKKLLQTKTELEKTSAKKNWEPPEVKSVSGIFSKTSCALVKKGLEQGKAALAVKLPGMAGFLGRQLSAGRRLGTELSDYAKARTGVSGILHSDEELEKYGISREESLRVGHELGCGRDDAWALCVAEKQKAESGLAAAFDRARAAVEVGVPKETRRAEGEDSVFMRPLPGAARMYPETDVPPVEVARQLVEEIRLRLPESLEEKMRKLENRGLASQLAEGIAKSGRWREFEEICEGSGAEPGLVAVTMLQTIVALSREGIPVEKIGRGELEKTLAGVAGGKIVKSAVTEALREIAAGKSFEQAVRDRGLAKISGRELEKLASEFGGDEGGFEKIMRAHRLNLDPAELKAALEATSFKQKKR